MVSRADKLARSGYAAEAVDVYQSALEATGCVEAKGTHTEPLEARMRRLRQQLLDALETSHTGLLREAERTLATARARGYRLLALGVGAWLVGALLLSIYEHELSSGAHWRASSAYPPTSIEGTLAGSEWSDKSGNYFFHTEPSEHPSLTIDSGEVRRVMHIEVVNRKDCCHERANSLVIESGLDKTHWQPLADSPPAAFELYRPSFSARKARFIRLSLKNTDCLHLSAVRVFGR
ncbi:MAG: discoidin domain-containing protein [Polyangiaceae bacterium]